MCNGSKYMILATITFVARLFSDNLLKLGMCVMVVIILATILIIIILLQSRKACRKETNICHH